MIDQATPRGNSLVRRSVGALKWSYVGVVARIVLQLVAQIALARFIGPEAFGVVSATIPVVLVGVIIAELGLGPALIQAARIERNDVRFAFTWIMIGSFVIAALIVLTADWWAWLFGNPEVAPALRWMSLAVVFTGFGQAAISILKRNLDFKTVQVSQVGSYFFGFFLIGVGTAVAGFGTWSLVAAWLSQTLIASVVAYAKVRHSLVPRLRRGPAPLAGYGGRIVFASLGNWSVENIDNFLVGRAFGTTALATYSIAYNLVRTPVNHIVFSLQQVFMPFIARAQDDPETMRKAYLTLLWAVTLVTGPAFVGLGAISGTAVEALYGKAWADAALVLAPLAFAMPLQAVQAVGGPVLWGSNNVGTEIKVSYSTTVLLVIALLITGSISIVAMGWGVFAVYLVRSLWVTAKASKILGIPLWRSLSMLWGGSLVASIVAGALLALDGWLTTSGMAALGRLFAGIAAGAVLLPLTVLVLARLIMPAYLHSVIRFVVEKFPERIRNLVLPHLAVAAD